ncbi:MAG: TerB N-terminal domain-containing protein [Coprothermobacterota bacterium]|nr:TerB N-terminal domain-containing protein [Coprothermobacterota bacterium]
MSIAAGSEEIRFFEGSVPSSSGDKERLRLELRRDELVLRAFRQEREIPLDQSRGVLTFLSREALQNSVDLNTGVLSWRSLESLRGVPPEQVEIRLEIAPEVLALVRSPMPDGFSLTFHWSSSLKGLERIINPSARYLGRGCFLAGRSYWLVGGTELEDDPFLTSEYLEGPLLRALVQDRAPVWRRMGLPYRVELEYLESPLFRAEILSVQDDRVNLSLQWLSPPHQLEEVAALPGFLRAGSSLRPGPSPSRLLPMLHEGGTGWLEGEEIPRFLQGLPPPSTWATGEVEALVACHRLWEGSVQRFLEIRREDWRGVGRVWAIPSLTISNETDPQTKGTNTAFQGSGLQPTEKRSFPWKDLLGQEGPSALKEGSAQEYLRLPCGWIERGRLPCTPLEVPRLFTNDGEGEVIQDGTFWRPVLLNADEILRRGSLRLSGNWTGHPARGLSSATARSNTTARGSEFSPVEFPAISLAEGATPLETAFQHLEFLRTWGFPGGLVGAVQDLGCVLFSFLRSCVERFSDFHALVVGSRTALREMQGEKAASGMEDPGWEERITLVNPPALEEILALEPQSWSLLVLLEADLLVHSPSSLLYRQLLRCRRELTLGLFRRTEFLRRALPRMALSRLFRVGSYSNLWKYSLRQPDQAPPPLPAPYQYPLPPLSSSVTEVGYAAAGYHAAPASSSIPIPPRPGLASSPEVGFRSPLVEEVLARRSSRFLEDALDLVSATEEATPFVPFSKGFPTYSDMDRAQMKWYLYWRDRVRKGEYLPTDLGAIHLYSYELINQVGVEDPMEGFQALRRLWLQYRRSFPSLDEVMVDWQADYLLVYNCPMDPLLVYQEAFSLLGRLRESELAFSLYLERPWELWPLTAIELALDYRMRWTEFWALGKRELLEYWVPRVFGEADRALREKDGRGILARFRPKELLRITRYPFQGARFRGELILLEVATVWPYAQHHPLRSFLTAVTQLVESALRRSCGFPPLRQEEGGLGLRESGLESELRERLEEWMARSFSSPEAPAMGRAFECLRQHVLPVPKMAPAIRFDAERIQYLQAEADQLQEMLAPQEEEEITLALPVETTLLNNWCEVDLSLFPLEWAVFVRRLQIYQVDVLRILLGAGGPDLEKAAHDLQQDSLRQQDLWRIAQAQALLPDMILDAINELALECFGDLLLEPNAELPQIVPEQRETLAEVLAMIGANAR